MVVAAALANLPAAWLYAWVAAPSPSVPGPLYTIGFGLWLAVVARGVSTLGKVRHPAWMWRVGAVLGVLAWYAQWAAWLVMSGSPESIPEGAAGTAASIACLCLRPDLMLAGAAERVANASTVVSGAARVVVWSVELGVCILASAMAGARRACAPFCEQTASWAKEVQVPLQFRFIDDVEKVRRRLEGNPRALYSVLVPCTDDPPRFADVAIHCCRGSESFVTVCNFAAMAVSPAPRPGTRETAAAPDDKHWYGQVDEPVVELLRFPVRDVDALIRCWERVASGLPACHEAGDCECDLAHACRLSRVGQCVS